MSGMFVLTRDGMVARPAPTTREGWRFLTATTDGWEDDDTVCCVGRVVGGMCVPVGRDDPTYDIANSVKCPCCHGWGHVHTGEWCPHCKGEGYL